MSDDSKCLTSGMIAGAIGGLVAAWVMNVFMEKAGSAVTHAAQHLDGTAHRPRRPEASDHNEDSEPKIDATMKTSDAVFSTVTGGRHLSLRGQQRGGPIVHYAFGALMGALYGGAAEYVPATRAGFGTVFASALFTGADLIAVPALHLSGSSSGAPVSSLASPLSAHIVYGVTTEAVRRLVRAAI
jgi:putative membrane protein